MDFPEFVSLAEFVGVDEKGVDALLGDSSSVVIPQGGDVMVYGDDGAGKTTLSIDLAFHLAAGDNWCGISVARPIRAALVENEGPRPLFRAKLRRKSDTWAGSDLGDRLHVLETPWGLFSFADQNHRAWLAAAVDELELDVVILGPLTRIGMNDAGTLQETRDFSGLLADVRARATRPITFVLIHHENKGGQVSGAWEGAGDTLLHVQAQGHGRTRLVFQKARWASDWHGKSLQLLWADGEGFTVADAPQRDANTIADEILAAIRSNGGVSWNVIQKAVGGNAERARSVRDQLLEAGQLVDANAAKPGKTMLLWDTNDPLCPLRLDTDTPRTHPGGNRGDLVDCVPMSALIGTQDTGHTSYPPPETNGTTR
jgi:AAA domain